MGGNLVKIKIKYHTEFDKPIQIIENGDWIDLKSAVTYEYKKGDFFLVNLGVSMELPKGYEALLLPRSSTFKKYGLIVVNSAGLIDNMYNSDDDCWMLPVYALRDGRVEKNDRVAQFRILENQPKIEFEVVEHLNNKPRGGFGSTGTK